MMRRVTRTHGRDVQMHKCELKLYASRAAYNSFEVGEALKLRMKFVENVARGPSNRRLKLYNRIQIEPVIFSTMHDRGADCAGSPGYRRSSTAGIGLCVS